MEYFYDKNRDQNRTKLLIGSSLLAIVVLFLFFGVSYCVKGDNIEIIVKPLDLGKIKESFKRVDMFPYATNAPKYGIN